jgi:GalNAc-alpha-(1->4)-GalNAc-alpha-(1->3)-diNAcBac-PP-undecaprenol alpha-1,4-N-acetyl-D-galactosaminyltransferase
MRLEDRIRLPGVTAGIEEELRAAHILAFPSTYEGFPNALAEGMAAGLPVIGMPEVSGVEELIIPGETGLLADWSAPVDRLADRLGDLMRDPALRLRLGSNARAHVAAFRPQMHYERWESLLHRVARTQA